MNATAPLNMDFSKPLCVRPDDKQWLKSPADGVSRVYLEREAAESGHTTSFVRFEPGSFFTPHPHPRGEEIYVLEGIFSDENEDYPAGTYIRNPPGSHHRPFTRDGCTLFVKLDQFQNSDTRQVVSRPEDQQWQPGIGGLKVASLHTFSSESTALVWWPENEVFQPHTHWGGEEIVVLKGTFIDEHGEYPKGSWIRSPHMSKHFPRVEKETLILVKVGHLNND
ncbi:MAG: cupin domain-containing protein [Gammaproteobacteria bacterium]|nr:MAG: cupin domain-containing protein [Gammaproteobacteria bacterium]